MRWWQKGGKEERPGWNFWAAFGIFLPSTKAHGVFLCSQVISSIRQGTSVNEQAQSRPVLPHTPKEGKATPEELFPFGKIGKSHEGKSGERRRGTNPNLRKAFQSN